MNLEYIYDNLKPIYKNIINFEHDEIDDKDDIYTVNENFLYFNITNELNFSIYCITNIDGIDSPYTVVVYQNEKQSAYTDFNLKDVLQFIEGEINNNESLINYLKISDEHRKLLKEILFNINKLFYCKEK